MICSSKLQFGKGRKDVTTGKTFKLLNHPCMFVLTDKRNDFPGRGEKELFIR